MTDMALAAPPPPWRRAFILSLPILVGYVPIGIGFGVLWVQRGLDPLGAPLLGLVVYAGASQFMAAAMLAAGQGPVEIALATVTMNARHALYGLAFLDRLPRWNAARAYFAFALTDETYAVLAAAGPGREDTRQPGILWRVALLNQGYWVLGCGLGALAGGLIPADIKGLDFALTALFVVLLLEQMRSGETRRAALVGGLVAAAGAALFGTVNTLLPIMAAALVAVAVVNRKGTAP